MYKQLAQTRHEIATNMAVDLGEQALSAYESPLRYRHHSILL